MKRYRSAFTNRVLVREKGGAHASHDVQAGLYGKVAGACNYQPAHTRSFGIPNNSLPPSVCLFRINARSHLSTRLRSRRWIRKPATETPAPFPRARRVTFTTWGIPDMATVAALPTTVRAKLTTLAWRIRRLRAVRGLGLLVLVLSLTGGAALAVDFKLDLTNLVRELMLGAGSASVRSWPCLDSSSPSAAAWSLRRWRPSSKRNIRSLASADHHGRGRRRSRPGGRLTGADRAAGP